MSKIVFVPLTDEMVFEHPEMILGPITTYKPVSPIEFNGSTRRKKSPCAQNAYLSGDMLNGLDVVYTTDKPKDRVIDRN